MEIAQLFFFIMASMVVIISPGQDLLLVMSRAVTQGSKAGVITASGVSVGLLGHSVLTSLGLGAMLSASASLFAILKCMGAVYLCYLGFRLLFAKSSRLNFNNSETIPSTRLFWTGAFSNISNPNITIFYFAFLPQFIPANSDQQALQLLCLGVCFAFLTFVVKGPVGYYAGILSVWLRSHPRVLRVIDSTSGAMLVGLGLKLAFERRI